MTFTHQHKGDRQTRATKRSAPYYSSERLIMRGKVVTSNRAGLFNVTLTNDCMCLASLSGHIVKSHLRIIIGDIVDVELSPYAGFDRGRIVWRHAVDDVKDCPPLRMVPQSG